MLKKLLKYDLEYIFRGIVIFYLLGLFFSVLTRIFLGVDNSLIFNIIGKICSGVTISMIFNILINNLMRLWARFRNNFYGDESYLTHTLPIRKQELYLSKFIMMIGSLFVSVLMIGLVLFIAYYSKENIVVLKQILLPLASIYDSTVVVLILVFLFIFFLEIANLIQTGYMGIILGNRMNKHKIVMSIIYAFIIYMGMQVVNLLVLFVYGLFNDNIMGLFTTMNFQNISVIRTIVWLSIIIYTGMLLIMYFINVKLFNKGVNVD